MPEGSVKSKLQRVLVQAKKISESQTKEKESDATSANATNIADVLAQLKNKTRGYVFTYKGKAEKADPSVANIHNDDVDSDAEDRANENALVKRMELSSNLKRKATRTMQMLMSNCLQNAFLFWKGEPPRPRTHAPPNTPACFPTLP